MESSNSVQFTNKVTLFLSSSTVDLKSLHLRYFQSSYYHYNAANHKSTQVHAQVPEWTEQNQSDRLSRSRTEWVWERDQSSLATWSL